jgi:hypothetical protein
LLVRIAAASKTGGTGKTSSFASFFSITGRSAAADCREVVVLSAFTPLLGVAFSDETVTLPSGVIVEDP